MTQVFHFKKFSVRINEGVFPVTTDSVLLGSWADVESTKNILDLGAGSGILSLMLAQRTEAKCNILAWEIDACSVNCCRLNFSASSWYNRLRCERIDLAEIYSLQEYSNQKNAYDLIISNPPYYSKQLNAIASSKLRNKHQLKFDYDLLVGITSHFLSEHGKVSLVLPIDLMDEVVFKMYAKSLRLTRCVKIRHTSTSPFSLALLEFKKGSQVSKSEELTLYQKDNHKTEAYAALVSGFYLD